MVFGSLGWLIFLSYVSLHRRFCRMAQRAVALRHCPSAPRARMAGRQASVGLAERTKTIVCLSAPFTSFRDVSGLLIVGLFGDSWQMCV